MDSRTEGELHESNEQFIAMLVDMARHDPSPPFEVTRTLAENLVQLDEVSQQRIAQRPFLLMDFRLDDEPWWQSLTLPSPAAESVTWSSNFPRAAAVEIARRALMLAWHRAISRPMGATLNLGMSPEVMRILQRMKLAALERTADTYVETMQPRWQGRGIWRRLLEAAKSGDAREMEFVDRLAAQHLTTDLLRKH